MQRKTDKIINTIDKLIFPSASDISDANQLLTSLRESCDIELAALFAYLVNAVSSCEIKPYKGASCIEHNNSRGVDRGIWKLIKTAISEHKGCDPMVLCDEVYCIINNKEVLKSDYYKNCSTYIEPLTPTLQPKKKKKQKHRPSCNTVKEDVPINNASRITHNFDNKDVPKNMLRYIPLWV